ncbi:uncharacterized protein LOC135926887 [Gordionus sp. m RMFG-2023]|uniref:uncharacterized protein LOC135926887 n=1 Tax=Gordionus sp. m RMFG-2023 TaxID=3053472 RepID=UPI0031FD0C70
MLKCGIEKNYQKAHVEIFSFYMLLEWEELQDIVHTYNHFASQFLRVSSMIANGVPNISLNLKSTQSFDIRYRNKPTSSEIAVLLPADGSDHIAHRDIILKTISGPLRRINELHSSYDPLQYVLLFPRGDIGYHPSIHYRNSTNKYVTCREYYAYRFMRQDDENVILRSKSLFHQFIVDSYSKQEMLRLNFIRNNQSKLRAELYQGIHDAILEGDTNADNLGRRIILPSSFTGSPRHIHQLYQDAMAIVLCFGKLSLLSLFTTFTCNPKWDEIMRELFRHQTPNDRPDLVCRVFRQKLKCLKKDLLYYHVLGRVIAYIDVIEFQKRGLPHCHMCLILDKSHRLPTADTYDEVVCAEIPNKITEPKLFQIISNFNTHGPCGITFPNSPCMIDGKCSKKYPKSFVDTSSIDKYGYPLYRRRNDGVTFQKKLNGFIFNNRWIIPYNKHLSKKYNAHINVEICSSIQSIKYLYKYRYKGHDRTTASLSINNVDETTQFIDARYISAIESLWRTLDFEMQDHSPAVYRLDLHLPNQHLILFQSNTDLNNILTKNPGTKLTEWGDDKVIRIRTVSPKEGEVFYLRLSLNYVAGPTCFEDLLSFNGIVSNTFKDACIRHGLLSDDAEWNHCLEEGLSFKMPYQLRQLFSVILLHCELRDPLGLWNSFKFYLCEDFAKKISSEPDNLINENLALCHVNQILIQNGKSLKDFLGMPIHLLSTQSPSATANIRCHLIREEISHDTDDIADETITEDEAKFYPTEFLNSLSISGLPPHKLLFKVGVPIILMRNLNSSSALNNGTKRIITPLLPNIIEAKFVSGSFLITEVLIPRISLIPTDSGLPFSFKRRQFPVRPVFVMTINKAQLYVAMSRVCSPHKLKIITNDKTRTTINDVYQEVISD